MRHRHETSPDLEELRAHWLSKLFATAPAERPATELAIRNFYRESGLDEPRFMLWCEDPREAGIIVALARSSDERSWMLLNLAASLERRAAAHVVEAIGVSSLKDALSLMGGELQIITPQSLLASDNGIRGGPLADNQTTIRLPDPSATGGRESYRVAEMANSLGEIAHTFHFQQDDIVGRDAGPGPPGHPRYPDFSVTHSFFAGCGLDLIMKADFLAKLRNRICLQPYAGLVKAAEETGAWWLFTNAVVFSEHPQSIYLDSSHHLHNPSGPAITYRSGVAAYAWHGEWVPSTIAATASDVTLAAIRRVKSPAAREFLIENYGRERFEQNSARRR